MRLIRNIIIVIGVLAGLAVAAHFVLQANARKILSTFVHDQSNGKLLFQAKQVNIDYFKERITFKDIAFVSTELNKGSSRYTVSCPLLIFDLRSLRTVLTDKKIQLDKILVESPKILIHKQVADSSKVRVAKEWGEVYQGIQKSLSELYLQTFQINNATITIIPDPSSGDKPIVVGEAYLTINQFLAESNRKTKPVIQAKKIQLTLHNQRIFFPNRGHYLRFKKLDIDTEKELIFVQQYALRKPSSDTQSYYNMVADTLMIGQLDFEHFYETGDLHAGKVYLGQSEIELQLHVKEKIHRTPKKSMRAILATFFNQMEIDTLQLSRANATIRTKQGDKTNELIVEDVNLYADQMKSKLTSNTGDPVSFGKLNLHIQDYRSYLGDSSYQLDIGNIQYDNRIFRFEDIKLLPVQDNQNAGSSVFLKAMELDNLSIIDLLFHKKLVADRLLLDGPRLDLTNSGKKSSPRTSRKKGRTVQELLDSVFQVKLLQIRNGDIAIESKKGYHTRAHALSLDASINNTVNVSDPDAVVNQIQKLSFRDLDIKTKAVSIRVDGTQMKQNQVEFSKLQFATADGKLKGVLYQVRTAPTLGQLDENQLQVDGLSWKKGDVYIQLEESNQASQEDKPKSLDILLQKLSAQHTNLFLSHSAWKGSATIEALNINEAFLLAGKKPSFKGTQLNIQNLKASKGPLALALGSWRFNENSSTHQIQSFQLDSEEHDTLQVRIPKLQFDLGLQAILDNQFNPSNLKSTGAVIHFAQNPHAKTPKTEPAKKAMPLVLTHTALEQLNVQVTLRDSLMERTVIGKDMALHGKKIEQGEEGISLEGLELKSPNMRYIQQQQLIWNGKFATTLAQLTHRGTETQVKIQEVFATGDESPEFQLDEKKGAALRFDEARIGPIQLQKKGKIQIADMIRANQNTSLELKKLDYENEKLILKVDRISSSSVQNELLLNRLQFQPKDSPFVYMAKQAWQTDYITLQTNELKLQEITVPDTGDINSIRCRHILVTQPSLYVYRDKTVPFRHDVYKALPTAALQKIKQPFKIDSITVRDGRLQYQEKSDKTELVGTIRIDRIQARLRRIQNYNLQEGDSLLFSARARFMEQANFYTRIRQSYTDSLHGFQFYTSMGPFSLPLLNGMTEPAVSVKIKSGQLDTLYLHAIGREYLSLGTLHMPYRQLKVQFLKNGDATKKDLLSGLITFAANSFVIKKNNPNRTGVIYFPRNQEKSIFNYMVKMVLSGAASSAGAKSNKKSIKQYRKQLTKRNLPIIPEEILE